MKTGKAELSRRRKGIKSTRRAAQRHITELLEKKHPFLAASASGKAIAAQLHSYCKQGHGDMKLQDAVNEGFVVLPGVIHSVDRLRELLVAEVKSWVRRKSQCVVSDLFEGAEQVYYYSTKGKKQACLVENCPFFGPVTKRLFTPILQQHFPELRFVFYGALENKTGIRKEEWNPGHVHCDLPETERELCTEGFLKKMQKVPSSKWPVVLEVALEEAFELCVGYKFLKNDGTWMPGPKLSQEARDAKAFKHRRKIPPFSISFLSFHQEHVTAPPLELVTVDGKLRLHLLVGPTREMAAVFAK